MIRNIAIIAHVDHGKTTLVDQMLRQAGAFRANQQVEERVMDSNPLERERGITILAKNTAVRWQGAKINIVDTPGHADFGGEVERILRMVDGVLILVDAAEGPMPQTRFVTRKALALGLRPIVAINKIDRSDAEPLRVHDEVLGLFIDLEADPRAARRAVPLHLEPGRHRDDRAGSRRAPISSRCSRRSSTTCRAPTGDPDGPFQMLVSTLDFSTLPRPASRIGRIERGRVRVGDQVALLPLGEPGLVAEESCRAQPGHQALHLRRAQPGRGGRGARRATSWRSPGFEGIEIGKTFTAVEHPERLAGIAVEEPTISVDFIVNNGPVRRPGGEVRHQPPAARTGCTGSWSATWRCGWRTPTAPTPTPCRGRGELHLGILMETMRREGYEFQVSRPRVITKLGADGERLEPYEELMIDVPEEYMGVVMEKLGPRRGEMIEMRNPGQGHGAAARSGFRPAGCSAIARSS